MAVSTTQGHDPKYTVQVLTRAVTALAAVAEAEGPLSLDDLGSATEINKPSLLRILRTLESERLVRRSESGYALGPRVLELSHGYLRGLALDDVARPYMADLARHTRQTVSLAIRDGLDVVYVAIEQAQQEIGIQGSVGARHPVNATALGKVLLAGLDDDTLRATLDGQPLPRLTHRTITDPDALVRHLVLVRAQGYADDDEERGMGIRCVAAPIRRADGRVIAAMSIAGAIFHMTEDVVPEARARLVKATDDISAAFGRRSSETTDRPHALGATT
ncbi:IclR family transcriptional regulator [soil metagenome]